MPVPRSSSGFQPHGPAADEARAAGFDFREHLEPYENTSNIVEVRRVEMAGFDVAVQIKLKDGRADLLLAADASQAAKPGAEPRGSGGAPPESR